MCSPSFAYCGEMISLSVYASASALNLVGQLCELWVPRFDLSVLLAHLFWSRAYLGGDGFREHRPEVAKPEVFHQSVRPRRELFVKAAADDGRLDVNALNSHGSKLRQVRLLVKAAA
jgi:hypothetical protein